MQVSSTAPFVKLSLRSEEEVSDVYDKTKQNKKRRTVQVGIVGALSQDLRVNFVTKRRVCNENLAEVLQASELRFLPWQVVHELHHRPVRVERHLGLLCIQHQQRVGQRFLRVRPVVFHGPCCGRMITECLVPGSRCGSVNLRR